MGKRHKQRHKARHAPKTWAREWREAESYGCVVPDYVPDCPMCETDKRVAVEPFDNTGIFACFKCGMHIVVLRVEGDETALLLEELDSELKELRDDLGEKAATVIGPGLGVYSPMALVEDSYD